MFYETCSEYGQMCNKRSEGKHLPAAAKFLTVTIVGKI